MAIADEKSNLKEAGKFGGNQKLMIVVIALLVLLIGAIGGLAYVLINGNPAQQGVAASAEQKKAKSGPPIFQKMDTFVVNLAGKDGMLLQVEMQAQLANNDAQKAFVDYMPKIRSGLILLLSSKTAEELSTPDGKVKLKAQVKKIINESMDGAGGEEPVESVLFTSFIIQAQ
ncbi:flagellar basal body-associated FliL family protein [Crenobacter sp. SG2303]|uniref:Flagellar protein FliL n=1 Tax=Crenobacter oryzisoli TaxID=3056844 RepID=A0ABT7XK78_9NEIS|nr:MULTISPECIES: flagellar basal body-associated FliL family protein [unclassified Crenobacter]MDN0074173.1 flagellar basal body-associated FliL family protein [Crenobacter sp. SG2303]MDN0083444.1 flagellar basal body-associated FliL family protein [Crenobacter sp. SG2305]